MFKGLLLVSCVSAVLVAGSTLSYAELRRPIYINSKATQRRVAAFFRGHVKTTPLDRVQVNGKTVTESAVRKARETERGFDHLYYGAHSTSYLLTYRTAGRPLHLVATRTRRIEAVSPGGSSTGEYFVFRSARTGRVVGRGHFDNKQITWTRGKNGTGQPERNLAAPRSKTSLPSLR